MAKYLTLLLISMSSEQTFVRELLFINKCKTDRKMLKVVLNFDHYRHGDQNDKAKLIKSLKNS